MDYLENTHEAADRVKHFLKRYGNVLFTVILVVIVFIIGLQYWHKHQTKVEDNASVVYENLLGSVATQQNPQIQAFANQLINDYSDTPYASYAGLMLAKQAVNENKLPLAMTKLEWVISNADVPSIKNIAIIRLARVQIAANEAKQAIKTLDQVKQAEFLALANTIKGDAYLALKQTKQAKLAYMQALKEVSSKDTLSAYIQMKLYSL